MPLTLIIGYRGSGKTLLMVRLIKNQVRICYSNFKVNIKTYHSLKLIDMLSLPDNINVLLDEGYTWLESRTSTKYINLFMSYIVFQLRKTNRNIFVSAQELSSIDIRYRLQWDYLIKCERIYDSSKKSSKWDFKYIIYDKRKSSCSKWVLPYENAIKLFHLFDTNEIVPVSSKSRIEYELLKTQPKQLMTNALKIAKNVKKNVKVITQESIKFTLMILGYDQVWHNSVYLILKNYLRL